MRKLKLQVQMSVDGFICGPHGEMDWMIWNWDMALQDYVKNLTTTADCVVLGRKLAEGFIPHWASVAANPDTPEQAVGIQFTDIAKVVFTKTLEIAAWLNTVLAKGDLVNEITSLKKQEGKDIMVYGGASFVSALIKNRLIDEFHLFMNPAALGKGMPIFYDLETKLNLTLVKATSFECGMVVLHYVPKEV